MRAITLTQPWAGLVASGIKLVENRDKPIISPKRFGETIGIHASREIVPAVYDRIRQIAPELFDGDLTEMPWYRLSRITSAVIGVATIDKVFDGGWDAETIAEYASELSDSCGRPLGPQQVRWFFGPIGYVMRDVRALSEPVRCRGGLSNWKVPDDVAERVTAQIVRSP